MFLPRALNLIQSFNLFLTAPSSQKNKLPVCCCISLLNVWHLRALWPANATLLQDDSMLKSQKANWSDKIFPITDQKQSHHIVWVSRLQRTTLKTFSSLYDAHLQPDNVSLEEVMFQPRSCHVLYNSVCSSATCRSANSPHYNSRAY